jgi:uncharacterized cysteine cluster protein YcgN (CxxCxxCC family)
MTARPFWETTALAAMSDEQWESLCDGCGRCCLHKLQDAYTDRFYYTDVACRLLDDTSCRCSQYSRRKELVPDCMVLPRQLSPEFDWLPDSCAYRRLDEGRGLAEWHPLVSGDPDTVHLAGISVRGRTRPEHTVNEEDLEEHIIHWVTATDDPD